MIEFQTETIIFPSNSANFSLILFLLLLLLLCSCPMFYHDRVSDRNLSYFLQNPQTFHSYCNYNLLLMCSGLILYHDRVPDRKLSYFLQNPQTFHSCCYYSCYSYSIPVAYYIMIEPKKRSIIFPSKSANFSRILRLLLVLLLLRLLLLLLLLLRLLLI